MSLLTKLDAEINEMAESLNHIRELSDQIGGFNDGPHLHEQIQNEVRSIMQASKKAKDSLLAIPTGTPGLDASMSRFEQIRSRMQTEIPGVIGKLRQYQNTPSQPAPVPNYTEPLLNQSELDDQSEELQALEAAAAQILSQMREVQQLFAQTLDEIQKQRHKLVSIETVTAKSAQDMASGNEQLDKAQQHMKGKTKCLIWIIVAVGVIIVGLVLFLLWRFKWSKK